VAINVTVKVFYVTVLCYETFSHVISKLRLSNYHELNIGANVIHQYKFEIKIFTGNIHNAQLNTVNKFITNK